MTIEEIKEALHRKAVIFQTGGFKPMNAIGESWIGCIKWKRPEDEIPVDVDGAEMLPLAMIFTGSLEYAPKAIEGVALLNVFISPDIYDHLMDLEGYYHVEMIDSVEGLEPCTWDNPEIKAFPLKPELIEDDCPMWDGGMDPDLEDAVIELEESEGIDYFEDIMTKDYSMHKVGGYPAYIQSGDWQPGYELILQISSDEKAELNIVDNGSFYFFYNKEEDKWELQCDFY